ncbi:hypothetical protein GN157_01070 [Flavobacterium rakeshii]|uniref:Uncharacterized protein n=1 Tax=Flavobacterium rakeshii TaxID=1038845 RepID=A0A6N8H6P8_9FLAO|nr:hypothetical protein [Flavobacterium rakeshii]MUV02289.1 hypothetical protein [Flavobacterium rakeshii]
MKYFVLVCFLLIMSCKSGKDAGTFDSVIGIAHSNKTGAIVYSDSEKIYLIAGLRCWDTIYEGKKVKLKGNFRFVDAEAIHRENAANLSSPVLKNLAYQGYPQFYSVTNATWELYTPD